MAPFLSVRVVLNTAAFQAEVDFWVGSMGARRVDGWDRAPDDRGVLLELRPGTVVEVIDQGTKEPSASAAGTVLACQLASPADVDDRHARVVASLGAAAVLTPLGDRPWGHRSFSIRSPGGAEVAVYADLPLGNASTG
jgi:catechol 2,3-dioxygenase-like lactoylglutathione lyase family enzyme